MPRRRTAGLVVLTALVAARGAEARPSNALFVGASEQLSGFIQKLWHPRAQDGSVSGSSVEPPVLASASTTSLSVAWQAVDGAASYELYADNWWANDGKTAKVYSGSDRQFTVASLMPGTPTNVLVAALGEDGSELGRSAAAALSTLTADHCGNLPDATAWRASYGALSGTITACVEGCVVEGEDCVTACVKAKTGMGAPCSACWGAYYSCAEVNCFTKCAFAPSSHSCHDCSKRYCLGGAKTCVGIPDMFWPPDVDTVAPKMQAAAAAGGGGGGDEHAVLQE